MRVTGDRLIDGYILGALARSEGCGCSACNKQFRQALENITDIGATAFSEAQIEELMQRHPK